MGHLFRETPVWLWGLSRLGTDHMVLRSLVDWSVSPEDKAAPCLGRARPLQSGQTDPQSLLVTQFLMATQHLMGHNSLHPHACI